MARTRPTVTDGLEFNETDDGLVIYQEKTDSVHHLNHTAALVLALCDGTRDEDDIVDFLRHSYGLDEHSREMVRSCLHDLLQRGLVA